MSFAVRIEAADFVKRQSVTGSIWLELDGQEFPAKYWSDFPVIILGWWLTNIKPLIVGQASGCECPFMDGPLRFEVTKPDLGRWRIALIRNNLDGDVILFQGEVDPRALISGILSAADSVIDLSRRNGWGSDDLMILEQEAKEVKSLMESFLK